MDDLGYLLTGDPDDVITWHGRETVGGNPVYGSRRSIAHLEATNQAARAKHATDLVVIQGAYNTGVSASAGTHDGDAVYDVYVPGLDWWAQQRFLREHGWAAWYRYPPTFASHIHMVSLGYRNRVGIYVPGQVADYYAHRSGLSGHVADTSWHPTDIDSTIFDYSAWKAGQDDMPYTEKELTGMMRAAVAAELAPALEQLTTEHNALVRKLFANLRVILKERFGATDADLDDILRHLEP